MLDHINNIKEDRIKTGADLIVQAARGFIYDNENHCWIQKYEPCNIIVFEDLSRYNFKNDRPKRENTKLMQWSHREIVNETERQAALYGISVYSSTDASYSSRHYFMSGAPGIRCDRLDKNDFVNGVLNEYWQEYLPDSLLMKMDVLKPGDLVPSEIGSLFLTKNNNGKACMVNADMNAACNLQKRFWHQHTQLLRIRTINKDGYLVMESNADTEAGENAKEIGKRKNGQYLYNFGTSRLMLSMTEKGHFHVIEKKKNVNPPSVGKEVVYNLCNDPSGVFFEKDEWIGYKEYWDTVYSEMSDILAKKIK